MLLTAMLYILAAYLGYRLGRILGASQSGQITSRRVDGMIAQWPSEETSIDWSSSTK